MEGENRRNQGGQQPLHPHEVPEEIRPLPNQQCPRCLSKDTKFSYFNNNKRSQPRYFCRSCRRLWTQGGILRNIPPREWPVRRTRRGAEALRVAISSPPPSVGLSAGGGFGLATQNSSRPQQPAAPRLIFTRGNHLSLPPGINYLNPFANPVLSPFQVKVQVQGQDEVQVHGQGQGEDQVEGQDQGQVHVHGQGQDQVQDQDQGQIQSPPTNHLHQEPKRIQGFAALPNGVTWMQPPTSVVTTTTTNYPPPLDDDADIYWDNNNSTNVGGSSSGSSSVDWLAQFHGFDP